MSAVTSGAPFPRARSGKRSDRPQKWGNPGIYFIALLFISVSLALLCFGVWFFLFAGNSGPTT